MSKKLDAKDLVDKIERLARERMAEGQVVDLAALRQLKAQKAKPTVLVIEDDETMRAALKRILETDGIDVRTAADGTQLGAALDNKMVDLIMLDIGLPWINGFELAKLLKEHPVLKSIPLIFVSGHTSDADVKQGFSVGADDYIKKPFDIEKVRRAVQALLKLNKA
ncbi:MAG: response regulator [Bdellovibrionaceae bacterium]|nr:response regulator [Pseudobdellovibrionaceae bacterium]